VNLVGQGPLSPVYLLHPQTPHGLPNQPMSGTGSNPDLLSVASASFRALITRNAACSRIFDCRATAACVLH
jgi:hypothetical protein